MAKAAGSSFNWGGIAAVVGVGIAGFLAFKYMNKILPAVVGPSPEDSYTKEVVKPTNREIAAQARAEARLTKAEQRQAEKDRKAAEKAARKAGLNPWATAGALVAAPGLIPAGNPFTPVTGSTLPTINASNPFMPMSGMGQLALGELGCGENCNCKCKQKPEYN